LLAQHDKLPAHIADRFAIIFAEVRDRLEVRRQALRQPHQLDIALRFTLKPTARLDAVEVAINVQLEKNGGMVSRPARLCWLHPREAQWGARSSSSTNTSTTRTGLSSAT